MLNSIRFFFKRGIPWIALAHIALFMGFWLTNRLFFSSTNNYLGKMLGRQGDYISLLLVISALFGIMCIFRLVWNRLRKQHPLPGLTDWLFGFIAVIYLVFFYGSFGLLLHESPVQLPRILQLLAYYRLILDPLIFLGVVGWLGWWVRRSLARQTAAGKMSILFRGVAVSIGIVLLWAIPVLLPPGSVYSSALPPKPLIIAHRGASMLAPENTLASAQLAASIGVYGLETDIHISQDGMPFLMHDDTLNRTTDVQVVFPGRELDRAESFTLAEVRQLNAGKWFVDQDPFGVIARKSISPEQIAAYQRQMVPTLAEELAIVRDYHLRYIFDLKQPPSGNPFTNTFFEVVLQQLQQAGVDAQVWFLVDRDELAVVQKSAPLMKPAAGIDYQSPPPASELKREGYQVVNAEYGLASRQIQIYRDAGLWVNLYTIDEPWQYSRLWLLGVDSTTTSNAQALIALERPILGMPYLQYLVFWGVIGAAGMALYLNLALPAFRAVHPNPYSGNS